MKVKTRVVMTGRLQLLPSTTPNSAPSAKVPIQATPNQFIQGMKKDKEMTADQGPKKKNRESSIRWQGRTIEQFGYALNLILGLTVAAIGFELSVIMDKGLKNNDLQNCLFAISIFTLLLSVAVGLLCVVTRLRDFRATAETARKREDDPLDPELQPLRTLTRELGKRTWLLFWCQISTFGIGVLLLILAVGSVIAKAV